MYKKLIFLLPLIALSACHYVDNRANDALDVFTLTVGPCGGAMTQVGPLHAGLGVYFERWGLRGGDIGTKGGFYENNGTRPFGWTTEFTLGGETDFGCSRTVNKSFYTYDYPNHKWLGIPLVMIPKENEEGTELSVLPAWFDINVAGGAFIGFRVGFNIGEFADFLVGFTTLDLFDDDIADLDDIEENSLDAYEMIPSIPPDTNIDGE